jgi:hypothetical protein
MLVFLMVLSAIPSVVSDGGSEVRSRGTNILIVDDTTTGSTGIIDTFMVLSAAGHTVTISKESALPNNWDPANYDSIFWFDGVRYFWMFWWFGEAPTSTNAGKLINYVRNGGNVMVAGPCGDYCGDYPGGPGPNEVNYFNEVVHHYCGNQWNGGGTTNSQTTKNMYITDPTHPVLTTPNVMPMKWTITATGNYRYGDYYSPSGTLNGGQSIVKLSDYTNLDQIVVSELGGGYGKTVFVKSPLEFSAIWKKTSAGDLFTPLIQNIAAWFGPGGIPAEVVLEPQSLNLDSMGNFVNVKVEGFPDNPEYTPMDVDKTSVAVGGVGVDLKYGTWNNNRWIGKADRLLVEDAIGAPGDEVEVNVNGRLNDGVGFAGNAKIKAL